MSDALSFTWEGTIISVRELTNADDLRITKLMRRASGSSKAGDVSDETIAHYAFAEFMIGAQITGDAPLPMVDEKSPAAEIGAAVAAWGRLPRRFGRRWQELIAKAEGSNDPK